MNTLLKNVCIFNIEFQLNPSRQTGFTHRVKLCSLFPTAKLVLLILIRKNFYKKILPPPVACNALIHNVLEFAYFYARI